MKILWEEKIFPLKRIKIHAINWKVLRTKKSFSIIINQFLCIAVIMNTEFWESGLILENLSIIFLTKRWVSRRFYIKKVYSLFSQNSISDDRSIAKFWYLFAKFCNVPDLLFKHTLNVQKKFHDAQLVSTWRPIGELENLIVAWMSWNFCAHRVRERSHITKRWKW